MRTAVYAASALLLASLLLAATPASAVCVTYGSNSEVCAEGNVGVPSVGNDGDVCIDAICPSIESNGDGLCVFWMHNGNIILWSSGC